MGSNPVGPTKKNEPPLVGGFFMGDGRQDFVPANEQLQSSILTRTLAPRKCGEGGTLCDRKASRETHPRACRPIYLSQPIYVFDTSLRMHSLFRPQRIRTLESVESIARRYFRAI
jgi:hypothetical protein